MNRLFTLLSGITLGMLLPQALQAQTNSVQLKASGAGIGYYTSIQNAYNAIPATLTQPYELELQNNYTGANETFPVTFINKAGASATNTITLTNLGTASLSANVNTTAVDGIVLDNADWVIINSKDNGSTHYPTFRLNATGATQSRSMVVLKNGASNNIISNIELDGVITGTTGNGILVGAGGNINNTIEKNVIRESPVGILSAGSIGNPNDNLTVRGNVVAIFTNACIVLQQGAGKSRIDSNTLVLTGSGNEGYAIRHQQLDDSVFITRNNIWFATRNLNAVTRGVEVIMAGTPAPGKGTFVRITNNMLYADNGVTTTMGDTVYHTADSMTNLIGINLAGGADATADIVNNTVKLAGNMNGVTFSTAFSAALQNLNSNPSSLFRIENNILVNERVTGSASGDNFLVVYATPANLQRSDFNTYNSASGNLAKIGGNTYTTVATLRSALGLMHENQSNTYPVAFFDEFDLHLTRDALGNVNLMGANLGNVLNDDIDGQSRGFYTRGADEYALACNGVSVNSRLTASAAAVCMNDYVTLQANTGIKPVNGTVYTWQSRPAGSSVPFANVTGPYVYGTKLIARPTVATEYRFVDSCLVRPTPGISDTVTVTVNPLPDITGINETHIGLDYEFNASGNVADINPLTYKWNFGDGRTAGVDSPKHTYLAAGEYNVELYVVGICGTDTFRTTVNATLGVNDVNTGKLSVYPNPATNRFMLECNNLPAGENVYITITSMMGASVYKQSFRNNSSSLLRDVDMGGYAPGVYNVELRSGAVIYRGNIVLQ